MRVLLLISVFCVLPISGCCSWQQSRVNVADRLENTVVIGWGENLPKCVLPHSKQYAYSSALGQATKIWARSAFSHDFRQAKPSLSSSISVIDGFGDVVPKEHYQLTLDTFKTDSLGTFKGGDHLTFTAYRTGVYYLKIEYLDKRSEAYGLSMPLIAFPAGDTGIDRYRIPGIHAVVFVPDEPLKQGGLVKVRWESTQK